MASVEGVKAAADIAKQIITLSTGAVAFTITFIDKFRPVAAGAAHVVPSALYAAWVLFGLTILAALFHLMGLNGTLDAFDAQANGCTLSDAQKAVVAGSKRHEQWPGLVMLGLFVASIVAMIVAGFTAA